MSGGPAAGKKDPKSGGDKAKRDQDGRFTREPAMPRLTDASTPDPRSAADPEGAEVLARLERQAVAIGHLEEKVRSLEQTLAAEREACRELKAALDSERRAAAAHAARAKRDRAASARAKDEVERLRRIAAGAEDQVQLTWAQLASAERRLAWKQRRLWRKLLRRPPTQRSTDSSSA